MRVAVLSGGRSSEHEISLRSGEAVARGLEGAGHEALRVLISRQGEWSHNGEPVRIAPGDGLLGADAAFPALHGPYGEDGSVQGLLEWLDVPYVGSDVLASATCMDKLTLKRLLAHAGVPQVRFTGVEEEGWRERAEAMGLPLWVKPSRLGSSVGISRVDDLAALDEAVALAGRHDPRVIVEAHAEGREVECSVLGNDAPEASLPGEVLTDSEWYDFEAKYEAGGMKLVVPAPISDAESDRVRALALRVFDLASCAGLARCDFFIDSDGEVLVNEINTMPGFTPISMFPKMMIASGITYSEIIDRLVELALDRHTRRRRNVKH